MHSTMVKTCYPQLNLYLILIKLPTIIGIAKYAAGATCTNLGIL